MATVFDVAEWFLHRKSFTHKQLQKLCYYAQAWHYVLLKEKLFDEEIQAWIHGPVCPALYARYASYGWESIKKMRGKSPIFSDKTLSVLWAVYNTYSKLTGAQLEALTHSELPWRKARGNLKPYEPCENKISCESMMTYYGQKFKEAQGD
ncbi:MAG: DUF4065 domain-containing protein [Bacteroidales bacterium]|nr:DUF4065 domain-containing protein [Bacteroidales bacterium]